MRYVYMLLTLAALVVLAAVLALTPDVLAQTAPDPVPTLQPAPDYQPAPATQPTPGTQPAPTPQLGNAPGMDTGMQDVVVPQQVFEAGHLQVVASSAAGQSEYAALTSARYVAMKRILETVQGLNLTGKTTIRDGMLESEVIQASVSGFIQGAQECGSSYDPVRGIGTVCLRLGVTGQGGLYDTVYPVIESELNITTMPPYQSAVPAPPQLHDGLIVDVRAFPDFRPAMVNRILVDNDTVIFEPARVSSAILVERGCGGYTNTLDKARAQLEAWGCANPLVIAAVGVQNGSDVVIGLDDADAAFSDNETTNMFANARVVYLLQ